MPDRFFISRISSRKSFNFLKRLSIFLDAGLPLSTSIDASSIRKEQIAVSDKVKTGSPLSLSISGLGFPTAVIGMIAAGEKNGTLSSSVSAACRYLEKRDSFRKKIVGSLIYPSFVLVLCGVSIIILMSLLLPTFTSIFDGLGVSLPLVTRLMIRTAGYSRYIGIAVLITAYFSFKHVTGDGGLNLPVIGAFRKKMMAASFFSSMAGSLSAGMSVIDSLKLSADLIESREMRSRLAAAVKAVSDGGTLSGSLSSTSIFDETALSLVSAGEASSSLERVFSQLSFLYEEEIEGALKTMSGMIEPISTLACGVVVGIIVFAMFMPIIKLVSVLGG